MEKQTIESGWGLQDTKGIREAPVVLGTYGRLASKKQEKKTQDLTQQNQADPSNGCDSGKQALKAARMEDFLVSVSAPGVSSHSAAFSKK